MKMIDETGNRYGRLLVKKRAYSNNNRAKWECICDCGNITIAEGVMLRSKKIRSCGCLKDELTSKRFITHGLSNTKLYDVWIKIKSRCYNKNDKDYKNYGGRGITVYKKWKNDFKSFYDWAISNGYDRALTIERIDVNDNYKPSNCSWIKNELQALNTRKIHKYSYKNEFKDIRYFSEKYNINYNTLRTRLLVYKWDIKRAIETIPIKGRNQYGIKTISN